MGKKSACSPFILLFVVAIVAGSAGRGTMGRMTLSFNCAMPDIVDLNCIESVLVHR